MNLTKGTITEHHHVSSITSSRQEIAPSFRGPSPNDRAPVDSILAERGGKLIKVSLLRYFTEPALLDDEAKAFFKRGMTVAMEWAVQGRVAPHIGKTIDSTVEAINAGLESLRSGHGTLGKVAVIVDRDLAAGK